MEAGVDLEAFRKYSAKAFSDYNLSFGDLGVLNQIAEMPDDRKKELIKINSLAIDGVSQTLPDKDQEKISMGLLKKFYQRVSQGADDQRIGEIRDEILDDFQKEQEPLSAVYPELKKADYLTNIKRAMEAFEKVQSEMTLKSIVAILKTIRWPFWRLIEHPLSTVVTDLQKGKMNVATIKRAAQAYVPFRKIPEQEYGNYEQIWANYWESILPSKAPEWYKAMSSFGTAVGVEVPAIRGVTKAGIKIIEKTKFRPATQEESKFLREFIKPLRDGLKKGGLDPSKLHDEGNIIKLTDDAELFLNKYQTAIVKGENILVPKGFKIKVPKMPAQLPGAEKVAAEKALATIDKTISTAFSRGIREVKMISESKPLHEAYQALTKKVVPFEEFQKKSLVDIEQEVRGITAPETLLDSQKKALGLKVEAPKDYSEFIKTETEPIKPTDTLLADLKQQLVSKTGAVTIPGEPLKAIETAVDRISNTFTRYRNLDDVTREELVAFEEMIPKEMENAANTAMAMVGKKFDKATREAIMLHMDNPAKYPAPEGTEEVIEKISSLQDYHKQVLKQAGHDIQQWPEGKIAYLNDELDKLKTKDFKSDKAIASKQARIEAIRAEIEQLKSLGYIHRVSRKTVKGKLKEGLDPSRVRKVSTKPVRFMGRSYNTIDEARKAGIKVGDLTESVAETLHSITKTAKTSALIKAINQNEAYSLPLQKAPSDWETIDPRIFPHGSNRKYHPAMANALKELTYTGGSKNLIVKAYDKINIAGKLIGFYNPFIMTKYNTEQGWRAAGLKFFANWPEAFKIWAEKGDKYYEFMKGGLFNKTMDYKPGVSIMVKQMIDMAEKSYPKQFVEKLVDGIGHPLKALQVFNNKTTWQADEVLRIATRLAIENQKMTKGLSAFQKTDLANDFHAAYNKFPKGTKQTLNRIVFTPTYKASMARILVDMHKDPKRFTAPLIRHHGYRLFIRHILPVIIGYYVAKEHGDEIVKVFSERGYRVVVKIGDKVERVYAISGPMLEEAKVVGRKPEYTAKLNLAFVPNLLLTWLGKKKYVEPNDLKRISEYFKIGAPGIREYLNWQDKDKTTFDKFLTQTATAYAYTRFPSEPEQDERNQLIKALNAIGLMPEWMESKDTRERLRLKTRYRYYSDELYRAVKRRDSKTRDELQQKAKEEFGRPFPMDNITQRISLERKKRPTMTKEEQQIMMENKFIRSLLRE